MMRNPANFSRRHFLRSSGIALGLPVLHSLLPRAMAASAAGGGPVDGIRRMLAISSPLGFHTPFLFPEKRGFDYEATPYLEPLQEHRGQFSVISGLMHPDVDGGHAAEQSFLTAAPHPGSPSFRNTISVDQYAAERMGHLTRFQSLTLSANHGSSLAYTRAGVRIPGETRPSKVFERLFLEGSADEKAEQVRRLQDGQSVMDLVMDDVKRVERRVGREDHEMLNQYLSSVRDLEQRLVAAEEWAHKPKPVVEVAKPTDIEDRGDLAGRMSLMYDLTFLALQTDSTRLVTFVGAGDNEVVSLKGVDDGWHNLSHHGLDPDKIAKLAIIEREEMRLFGDFLGKLKSVREGEKSLLEQTAVILGSSMGNASSHNNTNLPILFAGGNFKHGQHLGFEEGKGPPLANLFVSCLQHLGVETDRFASGVGTLRGI